MKILLFFYSFLLALLILIPQKVYGAENVTISELPLQTPAPSFSNISYGPDGSLWFVSVVNSKIVKISPSGLNTEFDIPVETFGTALYDITPGPDGNMWFTDTRRAIIGKITRDGIITEYYEGNQSSIYGITSGADGNLWYSDVRSNSIGRITPKGVTTKFSIPDVQSMAYRITLGPDGNVWFAAEHTNKIGRIKPNGEITQFTSPSTDTLPHAITAGPDGNVWFTKISTYKSAIGKITPNGNITEYPLSGNNYPDDIVAGADGKLWYTNLKGNSIGRISVDGVVSEYAVPTDLAWPQSITLGPDNNLWFTEQHGDYIGRVNISNTNPGPTPTLQIKDYKQTDPKWGGAKLGNNSICGTLYNYGCAVVSVADVFFSYGKTLLDGVELNPGTLNTWLGNHKGFDGCYIYWETAAAAAKLGSPNKTFRNGKSNWVEGGESIDNALNAGNLPILGVNTRLGSHFFVVSAKLPDVNGKPDYKIVDPALYPFTANNPGNTGKSLSQTYGGFDKVFETVVYRRDSSPQKTLAVRAHSPVQLLITDPDGNQTGYDEGTQEINENIPESSYGIEPGIAPTDESSPASGEVKYFQQINPIDGEYSIQLIGTGEGSYTLDIAKTDEEGNASTQVIKGYAQAGVTETYTIEYTSDATEQPVINKEVTFAVLKSDINVLYKQGQIKNKIVYTTLKLQVDLAEKATLLNKHIIGDKLAVLSLKTFQLELTKVRGKLITEDAYQILSKDIEILIKNLQEDSGIPTPDSTPTPGGS